MKYLKQLLVLILVCAFSTASAAITSGYYYVKSYNDKYLTENISSHALVCSDLGTSTNYLQVWYLSVSGSSVTFKNALTDRYVQKTTGNSWSEQYVTGTSSNSFTLNDEGSGVYTFTDKWTAGPHCDQYANVVLWLTDEAKSKWTVEAVTVNQAELTAQKSALSEATTSQLTRFFTSSACTALNSTYSSYSDANLRAAMSSLPTTVQDLAVKIKNNAWTTYSGWNKTEKTFRIADYKAYSSHTRWTTILGGGYAMGRLSNPTGIWVNSGDIIQVYVGSIPSGQSVALEVAGYGNASGTQYTLHAGMNSLLMATSGNCFVFYEVDNTTNGGKPYKLLSNYADVTVHIEGGVVQGYFDLTKGDTDSDWTQMKKYLLTDANNRPSVCLKTDKHVMNLGITRLINALNGTSITEMLNFWRDLAEWEDELMGRTDSYSGQSTYGQYCNTLYSVTALPGTNGSPHCSTYGTYYYEYSDPAIFNAKRLKTVADDLWCIAHEQGHSRQSPINMVGNTEVSNNLFSNMAIYKQGRYTSRTASLQEVFRDFQNGVSWPERVAKSCDSYGNYNQHLLHLNWSLYLYFHVLGKDPDFFPRLFDALRADPLVKVKSGSADNSTLTPADTDYLKYYVKCCQISGCDLTDFFASFGFFMIPPERDYSITYNGYTTNRFQTINDYGYYYLYVTQNMIDNAKNQVRNMNLPKSNIIFIEDRVTAPDAIYEGHASGEKRTINPDAPVKAFGQVGETGQYTDFDATCSAYAFNVDKKGHVTVSGTGAVGFIVYDADGNIAGFYNTYSFTLPENIGTGYTIKAAAGNGSLATMTKDSSIEVIVTDFPRTDMWYSFRSLRGNRYVLSNGAGEGIVGTTDVTMTDSKQWKFVARDGEVDAFDIVNRNDGSYLDPTAGWDAQVSTTTTQPSTGWRVEPAATDGLYIITTGSAQLNQTTVSGTNGNKIYNWGGGGNTSDEGCQFTIAEVEAFEVTEFPATDMWYSFRSLRGNRYVLSNGAGEGVVGTTDATLTDSKQWKFVERAGETEAFDIVNRNDGSYLDPTAAGDTQIFTTTTQPSTGWQVKPAATNGLYIITTGSVQLNQTNYSGTNGNKIYNWGGGGNTSDEGCQFAINAVEPIDIPELSDTALEELEGYHIAVASNAAANLTTGQWYVMYDRGITTYQGYDYHHGYLYEQVSSHTLYNTLTAPSGKAVDACRHLVRLIDAGGGKYYLQTGYGNYFGKIEQSVEVPVLSTMTQRVTIAKINGTDGHFYLQSEEGLILDANWAYEGADGTVVGYGTTVPTTINGNNDWAFYPVTLVGRGDVNADGKVTIADVTALVNVILGSSTDTSGVADVNGDSKVTIADVTALVNLILGK